LGGRGSKGREEKNHPGKQNKKEKEKGAGKKFQLEEI